MILSGKIWKIPGSAPRAAVKYAHGHNLGPLMAVCWPFRVYLECLYLDAGKRFRGASSALERNSMKKPGYDPRFSVFLAALLALWAAF